MPIRPQFATIRKPQIGLDQEPNPIVFQSQDFLGGLVLNANPEIIPLNAFQGCKNVAYYKNQLFRRPGLQAYPTAKPNISPVVAFFVYNDTNTSINFFRFTTSSIYKLSSSGWVLFSGPALLGSAKDLFSFTVADGRAFFTNGGVQPIQELLPGSNSYAQLGDAGNFKYLTSAFDRVIAANQTGPSIDPINISWSGQRNYSEWDPNVDISSGNTPLVNSPADTSDDITGLFYYNSAIIIPRQRSLWLATNLPSATQPFNFFLSQPKVGADVPAAISLTDYGLVFYNFIKSTVYLWIPGSEPIDISKQIRRDIKNTATNPDNIFATYNQEEKVWSLFISDPNSSLVISYSFYFETKTWTYDEFSGISCASDLDFSASAISINSLTGTIDNLTGTIDAIGALVENSTRFFGYTNGDVCYQSTLTPTVTTDNGVAFTSQVDSKTFVIPNHDGVYNRISIEYTPYTTGSVSLYYSKDGERTFVLYKTINVTSGMLNQSQLLLVTKPKRSRKLCWRFQTTDVIFSLDNYRVEVDDAGLSVTSS